MFQPHLDRNPGTLKSLQVGEVGDRGSGLRWQSYRVILASRPRRGMNICKRILRIKRENILEKKPTYTSSHSLYEVKKKAT